MSIKMTVVVAALLSVATVSATRCGELKLTTCTDDQCSVGCVTKDIEPSNCGGSFLEQAYPAGTSVGTRCEYDKATFKFYNKEQCTGGQYQEDTQYYYTICYPDATTGGSHFIEPTGERPQFYELTEQEYEERFNQRWLDTSEFNLLGYGQKNQYVPPIRNPTWLVNDLDRYIQLLESVPMMSFFSRAFFRSIGTGHFLENGLNWYNSADAAGSQLYPSGLSKYFDMYSFAGWMNYIFYWFWAWTTMTLSPFTLFIPFNIWVSMFNMSWEGIWKIFMPAPIIWLFHLRGENGWILA